MRSSTTLVASWVTLALVVASGSAQSVTPHPDNRDGSGKRTYYRVGGRSRVRSFAVKIPGYAGSCALSGDGRTAVWVDPGPASADHTFVWREQ